MQKLLIVEDDASVRSTMVTVLELEGYAVEAVSSTREAISLLEAHPYPIVISDIYLDDRTGIDILKMARLHNPDGAVILMSGRGSMETVMAATSGGAFDYLAKPFEMSQMIDTIKRAEKSFTGEEDEDEAQSIDDLPDTEMIGSSPRMVDIYKQISKVAPTDATVLIEGETGTGKDLIARMIHRNSKRAAGRSRHRCSKASCSGRSKAHIQARIGTGWACSRRPITGPFSWTKLEILSSDFN